MRAIIIVALGLVAVPQAALGQDGFGGARDIGLVRAQVYAGTVPAPDAFTVEGMLSEHHFPVREERCETEFCVLTAMGHGLHRPTLTRSAYLLLEPVSGIDPDHYDRPPVNLTVVIDNSGSMGGWKLASALQAAHALVDQLDERDTLSVVTFSEEAELRLVPTRVGDRAALHRLVDTIDVQGGTNVYDGLTLGFQQAARNASQPGVLDRVILLTDERPNVGVTGHESFQELVGSYAAREIGLTVLGVGLDLGADLADLMSRMAGGAYYFLATEDAARDLFGRDLPALLAPVAYHVTIRVTPGPGLRVADVFGVPGDDVVLDRDGTATLRAATVFLDRRRSGAVVRLEPTEGRSVTDASAVVSYTYTRASDGAELHGESSVWHQAEQPGSLAEFATAYHYRAYALVNFAELLRASLRHWHAGRYEEARRVMRNARHALDVDSKVTHDPELAGERELADRLLREMRPTDQYVAM